MTTAQAIAQLRCSDRFVRELPGDTSDDNRIRQVFGACYSRVVSTAVPRPELLALVPEVAALLERDPAVTPELIEVLAGNRVVPGISPYAACYGGHQFGTWAGQLDDGRAITLGEVVDAERRQRMDAVNPMRASGACDPEKLDLVWLPA